LGPAGIGPYCGGLLSNPFDVGFNALEVHVGATGVRHFQEVVEAAEVIFDTGPDVIEPESRCFAEELVNALEIGMGRNGSAGEAGGFRELRVEHGQLLDVIGSGHLAEEVGGGEGKAQESFQFGLEGDGLEPGVDAGAADHVLDGANFAGVKALWSQQVCGELGAAVHVGKGVLGAGARVVIATFGVTGVMKQDGEQAEFEVALVEDRHYRGAGSIGEQACEAERALQGMLQVMVMGVDGQVLLAVAAETLGDTREDALDQGGVPLGKDREIQLAHRGLDRPGVFRVNVGAIQAGNR
jgi:hypothetical protein